MKISSGPIQTYARTGLRESDNQRTAAQQLERVRRPPGPQQNNAPIEPTTETSQANRQVIEQAPVVAINQNQASQHLHRIYPASTGEHLPPSRQTAMHTYTTTQQMSREAQGSGEFLGTIDLFV
ncbi:hypothetical protein FT643_11475 [Ketobacter sp. MCCC 1A13808]|uniref:hypothetical protein n=1 Tax=Ketobacter sp. MCCC 1A13808 TaxID=2602738 RepID=UPI000F125733|nr:hypothetical protein [Ketobacter sp. MCCC 1A13808]MVF12762.1 hypothetical protein [Ketobacter sp. MCCC 1A13808]RLP54021.1 MAG: hypothetical protein D6160_13235 [Ketobacter sp.]